MKKPWLLIVLILITGIIPGQKIDQNNSSQEIKVEHTTKVKIDKKGLREKNFSWEPNKNPRLKSIHELDPNIRPSIRQSSAAIEDRVLQIKKTWYRPKEDLYAKGEIVVQLKNETRSKVDIETKNGIATFGIPSLDNLNVNYRVTVIERILNKQSPKAKEFGLDLIFLLKVPEELDLEAVSEEYRRNECVKGASPNYKKQLHDVPTLDPDDPNYDWAPQNTKNPQLWATGYYGSNTVNIAELEDVKYDHPDLDLNWSGDGYDFQNNDPDPYGTAGDAHGTRCIGTAIAETNNNLNVAGTVGGWNTAPGMTFSAWQCSFLDECIQAIDSAAEYGADVENISWGFGGNPAGLEDACNYAISLGTVICASAGNDNSPEPGWPAYYANVIAVGGNGAGDQHWDWGTGSGSNYGPWVDVVAPGDAQYTLNGSNSADNNYGGTSFSSPRVAAACAVIKHTHPAWTPAQIREALIRSADHTDYFNPNYIGAMGAGRVNLYEARNIYDVNVSVNEILDVPASTSGYSSIYPKAIVQNRGVNPASFDVIAQATQAGVVYADTIHVTGLSPNNEYEQHAEIVEFKRWMPIDGTYTFTIYATLASDQNTENDTISKSVNASLSGTDTLIVDSGIISGNGANGSSGWAEAVQIPITQPCSVVAVLYYPRNTTDVLNWRLWEDNGAGSSPGTLIRSGSVTPTISGNWYRVDLATSYYVAGGYLYAGWQDVSSPFYYNGYDDALDNYNWWYNGSSWVLDDYFSGDFMIRLLIAVLGKNDHDVCAYEIIEPGLHVIPDQPYIPQGVAKNIGKNTESFPGYFKIDSSGVQIYSESTAVNNLPPDVKDTLTFASWIPNWQGGTYNAKFYTKLSGDEDKNNDTISIDILCSATDTLYYDAGVFKYVGGDSLYLAVRYTAERSVNITGIQYYLYLRRESNQAPTYAPDTMFIWDAGDDPGTELHKGTHTPSGPVGGDSYAWYTYTLGTPVAHGAGDFWVGVWQPGYVGRSAGLGRDSTQQYVMLDAGTDVFRSKLSDNRTSWSLLGVDAMIRVIVAYQGSINDHDVMTKEITEPSTIVSTLYDYPVKADIKNIGSNIETFDVIARITESGGPQVYQQIVNVSSLNPGEIRNVAFPVWQPIKVYQYYDLEVYTTLGTDVDRSNDTIIQDSIISTPNEIIWYDNGNAAYYWDDPTYRYTAQRFTPEAGGWLIGCWVAMQSGVYPWAECSVFVWDDDDGWNDGGLPDPNVLRLYGPVTFDPGGTGAYWFYVNFPPVRVDTTSDFFIGIWNAEPPYILMDDTTSVWRTFCAEHPDSTWLSIGCDLLLEAVMRYDYGAPPKSPYVYTKKNATRDSIILYWQPVTEDTLNELTAIEWYEIYSNTNPGYVPADGDWLDSPSDTFLTELISTENRHYLNYAVSIYLKASRKSNMGYVFHKTVNENVAATDKNWVSLPYHSEYNTISDLTTDLSPFGDPLEKITNLRNDQNCESWIWDPDFFEWGGANFTLEPGRAYEMVTIKDTFILLVGSNNPDGLINLNENPSTTDKNWVSIPYNAVYSTVSDITAEYSPTGNPLEKITNLRNDQNCESWIWDPDFFEWGGANFTLEPGRAYEMVTIVDTTWNPTEYSNEAKQMVKGKRVEKLDIEVYTGKFLESERTPIWFTPIDNKHLVNWRDFDAMKLRTSEPPNFLTSSYRDAGISHIVRCHLDIKGFENLVFTTYRPDRAYDVLTEDMIGSCIMRKGNRAALWFDVANFRNPWQDKEEVILIIEAMKENRGYFAVINFLLDNRVDIQELAEISLFPIPEPVAKTTFSSVSWDGIDNANIIGYSLYQGKQRLNQNVITDNKYSSKNPPPPEVILKPVIKGGYETVYGSQGLSLSPIPYSYTFALHPNPFVKRTTVDYALPEPTQVEIKIYDVTGKLVKTLASEYLEPGYYKIDWPGDDNLGRKISAGIYFIQMNAKAYGVQQKIIFVH